MRKNGPDFVSRKGRAHPALLLSSSIYFLFLSLFRGAHVAHPTGVARAQVGGEERRKKGPEKLRDIKPCENIYHISLSGCARSRNEEQIRSEITDAAINR